MLQFFKNKSLKRNTKTGKGAGVRSAGVGAGVRGVGDGAGVQGVGVSAGVQGVGVGASVWGAGVGAGVRGAGVGVGVQGAGVGAGAQGVGVGASVRVADNKTLKKQRGRSMVEMLGVLAIIGVLSIGGISGYTIAMRRYRANEILNFANKYALTLYTACQNAIMNNPRRFYIDKYSWVCPASPTPATNAGLGDLPAGVVNIAINVGDPNRYIYAKSSGDIVVLRIDLSDKALCDTILNVMGTPKDEFPYPSCKKSGNKYIDAAVFINN